MKLEEALGFPPNMDKNKIRIASEIMSLPIEELIKHYTQRDNSVHHRLFKLFLAANNAIAKESELEDTMFKREFMYTLKTFVKNYEKYRSN